MARIVGEVMTVDVVGAHPQTPFKDVVRLLDRHRISGLPVVNEDDKVLGVISQTDLIRHQAARSQHGRIVTAREMMSTPAVTVHPEQRIADAARVMERHGVERLPVVDEEDRLIGIATRADLLRVFLRTDDEIRREVHDEVLTPVLGRPDHGVSVSVLDGMATLAGPLERGEHPSARDPADLPRGRGGRRRQQADRPHRLGVDRPRPRTNATWGAEPLMCP